MPVGKPGKGGGAKGLGAAGIDRCITEGHHQRVSQQRL